MKHQRVLHVSLASGLRQQKFEGKKKEEWVGVEEMIKGKRSTVNGAVPQQAPPPPPPPERKQQKEQQGPTCLINARTETEERLFYGTGQYQRKEKETTNK